MLRVHIDGEWWARDFAEVFDSIDALAGLIGTGQLTRMGLQPPELSEDGNIISLVPGAPRFLQVSQISFASPGSIDFVGLAATMEQIRLFLQYLIELFVLRNDRELTRQMKRVEILHLQVQIASELQNGDLDPRVLEYMRSEDATGLVQKVVERRVYSVERRDGD